MKKTEQFNFAEAFKELEGLVEWFETQEVDLEEGLKKFERGLDLAQRCRARLKEVENKVTQIKAKFADLPAAESDDSEDDNQAKLL
jgi:exodeoxyribonuclease VII small subunit